MRRLPRLAAERFLALCAALGAAFGGHPAIAQEDPFALPKGLTAQSVASSDGPGLSEIEIDGEVRSRLVPTPPPGNETDTDLALFAQGYVTLTLLDGDLRAGTGPAAASIISSLSALALPEPAARK